MQMKWKYRIIILLMTFIFFIIVGLIIGYQSLDTQPLQSGTDFKSNSFTSKTEEELIDLIDAEEVAKQGKQELNGDYLLWPPAKASDSEEFKVSFDDVTIFYNNTLSNEDIGIIQDSISYYCDTNKIPTAGMSINAVYFDSNGLYHTLVDVADTQLEQIYDKDTQMQRVDIIISKSGVDKFGVYYINMQGPEKEQAMNLFLRYVPEGGELYSVRELNCCFYYFYTRNNEQRYVRVSKKTGEITHEGFWDENGIIKED